MLSGNHAKTGKRKGFLLVVHNSTPSVKITCMYWILEESISVLKKKEGFRLFWSLNKYSSCILQGEWVVLCFYISRYNEFDPVEFAGET